MSAEPQVDDDDDVERVLALPRRPVVNCERDSRRRWAPETEALVDLVTVRYSRGPRRSCGCRDRRVVAAGGGVGTLVVYGTAAAAGPPPLPYEVTVSDFLADNDLPSALATAVRELRSGYSLTVPGLGHRCLDRLNAVQAWTLWEVATTSGAFGMCSVGAGKTAMGILTPLAVPGCKRAVVLIKPQQRLHYRDAYRRLREHFRVPSAVFDGGDGSVVCGPDVPVLHVVPYSLLSNRKSSQLLDEIDPDLVIADEGHLLANQKSTRTMRFMRFMTGEKQRNFCTWSGSMVNKSLRDCAHLATLSLGTGSPYPFLRNRVEQWAAVLDPVAVPDLYSDTSKKLRQAFGTKNAVERVYFVANVITAARVREGLRDRVIETPGVISTRTSSITCSLTVDCREVRELPEGVKVALRGVRNEAQRPDGEELVEPDDVAEAAKTVGAGFYHYWSYPRGEPAELIDRWFAARKAWNKELRKKLACGEPHLDSVVLCEEAAERAWREERYRGDLPVWPADAWRAWVAVKDLVAPVPRVRWIDDFLARDAATWATENRGVVWVQHTEFGKRVAELAGVNYCGGGAGAEARIRAETGERSVVVSVQAHGESLDGLQDKFDHQLWCWVPPSGKGCEQLLGRLAREGQASETVRTEVYRHTHEFRESFRKALVYAEFDQTFTPNQQLLLSADITFEV